MHHGRCHICNLWSLCGSPCASPCLRGHGRTFHKSHSSPPSACVFCLAPLSVVCLPHRQIPVPSSPRPPHISYRVFLLDFQYQAVLARQVQRLSLSLQKTCLMMSPLQFSHCKQGVDFPYVKSHFHPPLCLTSMFPASAALLCLA